MAAQYIFTIENLSKAFGKKDVLKNIWLSFYPGAKIGVIGGNGSGKSTLLRIMAGSETDHIGTARPAPGSRSAIYHRSRCSTRRATCVATSKLPSHRFCAHLTRFDEINARLAEGPDADEMDALLEEQAKVQDAIETAEGWDLDRRVEIAMDAMRLPPATPSTRFPAANAGAWPSARSCSNALTSCCWTSQPTISTPKALPGSNATCKNMRARSCWSRTIATSSTMLPSGSSSSTGARAFPGKATIRPGSSRNRPGSPSRRSKKAAGETARPRARVGTAFAPGRVAKNRARLQRYEQLASQDSEKRDEAIVLQVPPGPHLGTLVVEAQDLSKAYGDNLLFEDMSFRLPPGGIVGVVGPNGAGKTTLFRMIVGEESPDSGTLRMGDSVVFSYVDQNRDALAPDNTVFQEISGGYDPIVLGKRKVPARAYVAQFNFKGPDQEKKVGQLSGGERNRVHLAKLLKSGGNLLLLDEPTNDLDVEMLRAPRKLWSNSADAPS